MPIQQTHSGTIWREEKGSGAANAAVPVVFQWTGTRWVPGTTQPAQALLLDLTGSGTYVLTDIRSYTPPAGTPMLLLFKMGSRIGAYRATT